METLTLSHLVFLLAWFPSFAQNYQQVAETRWSFVLMGCLEPLTIACKVKANNKISFGSKNE